MQTLLKFSLLNFLLLLSSLSWSETIDLDFLRDNSTLLSIKDIINNEHNWQSFPPHNANFGFTSDAVWLRIPLTNTQPTEKIKHIRINYPMLDHVDAYQVNNGKILQHNYLSDYIPYGSDRQHEKYYLFSYTIPAQSQHLVYLRIETQSSMTLPTEVFSDEEYTQVKSIENYWFGALFGSLIIMGLYNLTLAISLRSTTYFLYVGYLGGFIFLLAALNGLGFQYIWSNYPKFNNLAPLIGAAWLLFFTLPLAYSFLQINRYSQPISRLFKALYLLAFLSILSLFVLDYQAGSKLMNAMNILLTPVILITALYFAWLNRPGARVFAIAWLALVVTLTLLSLSIYNLVPSNSYTRQAYAFGCLFELVTISLALARRINDSVHAKNQALKESKIHLSKYQDIYHNSPAGIFTANMDGSIANHNSAFTQIIKLNDYEIDALNIFKNLSKERSDIIKLIEQVEAGRPVTGVPVLCVNGKQEEHWLGITLSLQGEDKDRTIEGHITDIHDHMSRQQEKENQNKKRMNSLQLLIAGISHEINTPLGNNLTTLSFIEDIHEELTEKKNEDQIIALDNLKTSFSILKQNEKKIDQIIKRFAMVSTGYLQAIPTKLYGKGFLIQLAEEQQDLLEGLIIKTQYEGPEYFVTYEESLTIILNGLIDNSIRHGLVDRENGEIEIEMLVKEKHCEINYHDNGKGLKEDIKDQIFQPFFTTSRGRSETSGLGLYAIDNIVKNLFQGSLEIMDSEKNGFHLHINLPHVIQHS